jgi:hypothetical protein
MNYLKRTVKQSRKYRRGTVAVFASSTWTLAWCYAMGTHSPMSALAALPVLLAGVAAIGRVQADT